VFGGAMLHFMALAYMGDPWMSAPGSYGDIGMPPEKIYDGTLPPPPPPPPPPFGPRRAHKGSSK